MKNSLKNQEFKNLKFASLSREAMKNVMGASASLTKQEYCEAEHVGRCGVCDKDGTWTACA